MSICVRPFIRGVLCLCLFSLSCIAQQNFFNVPSSDIVVPKKVFFQEQINIAEPGMSSSTTVSVGLGKNFEVGANLLGVVYLYDKGFLINDTLLPYFPYMMLNAQKKFKVNDFYAFSIGTIGGLTPKGKWGNYTYLNNIVDVYKTDTKIVFGLYHASKSYAGEQSRLGKKSDIGIQFGIEQNIIKHRLSFIADYVSGKHILGQAVAGFGFYFPKNWVINLGYQFPVGDSQGANAVVVEFTYIPKLTTK